MTERTMTSEHPPRNAVPTIETVVERSQLMLRALEQLEADWTAYRADVTRRLPGHIVEVADDVDSLARGLVAVRLGTSAGPDELEAALDRAAVVYRRIQPLLVHSPSLREALERNLGGVVPHRQRWGLRRRTHHEDSVEAANSLLRLLDWADKTGYSEHLAAAFVRPDDPSVTTSKQDSQARTDASTVLAVHIGAPPPAGSPRLRSEDAGLLSDVVVRGRDLLTARERLATSVKSAFEHVQDRMVVRRLEGMDLETLRGASRGQVRIKALLDAGLTSVQDVLDRSSQVPFLPGVGQSGRLAVSTAHALRREVKEDLKLRFDLDENDRLLTSLITSLHALLNFDEQLDSHREDLERLVALLTPLGPALSAHADVALVHRHSPRRGADVARHLEERAAWVRNAGLASFLEEAPDARQGSGAVAWADFKQRSPVYYGLLGEVVGFNVDVDAVQGHMPREIVAAVEKQGLDTTYLKPALRSSLRGYQSFGARYALVQRRVLLGDEMGLGKTIQAIAAMGHLAAHGANHFVVVCPPAVLVNWLKEVRKHSSLEVHRVHGLVLDRERALRQWRDRGGVAVTSFTLSSKHTEALSEVRPDLLVIDEAHLVKNPTTQRAAAVRTLVDGSDRALFMTGTPLENKVEDFINLITLLQPEVLDHLEPASMVVGARKFREAVAPVYLRRNSNDVLSELPDRVESQDWVDMTNRETAAYLDALAAKDFHAMRRNAFTADPQESQKLERLEEIVDEADSNGRKVLIFSNYLDVIEAVRNRLGHRVSGTITGAVPPDERQRIVDRFTDSQTGGVLIGQITAAGVGLNLQAASVVILCEPQVKPSLEDQAVKRAHRMGQLQRVQVHRLLTTDSVDERMLEILATKAELFARFAAQSEVADASPQAIDITEAEVAREVIAKEQERHAAAVRARLQGAASESADAASASAAAQRPDDNSPAPAPTLDHDEHQPEMTAPKTSEGARTLRPTAPPPPRVLICTSCDRPIDVNGHCGCS